MCHGLERGGVAIQPNVTTVPSRAELRVGLVTKAGLGVVHTACRRGNSVPVGDCFGGKPCHTGLAQTARRHHAPRVNRYAPRYTHSVADASNATGLPGGSLRSSLR